MNGLKLGIGLEMQEVEAGLKTLTSKVTNTSQQLEGLLSIAPHINSRDFEVGIKRMKDAHEQFVKTVSAGIKIGWTKGKNSGSLRYDDLLGSRDRIEKSNSMIRDMLAGKVKTSFDKGKLTEIAQLQEAILKGANMATAAVDRETTSILKSIDAENKKIEKLKQSREARIESLNNQLAQTPLKTIKDLEKAVSLSKQVSAEMRKWNTADGNKRAAENDKNTAELQKQLDIAKRNAKEKERVNGLVQKQNELLRKQGEADKNSIAGLTERYNLSKKILEVQRQLVGTSRYDKSLIAAQQKIADPSVEKFNRKYEQHNQAYNAAVAANDFKAQLASLNSMRQMLLAQEVKSGMKFTNTEDITKLIEQTRARKQENDKILEIQRKQQKAANELINKETVLLELERRKGSGTNGIQNKLARLTEERKKLNSLITGWQDYYRTAVKAGDAASQSKAQAKLAALDKEKAKLVDLIALEKNRIRSVNQQKSLFNEQTSIFARLKSLATTYFSIYQVINFVKQIFNATKELERQKVALEGIVGSAAKATDTFNKLKTMAIESPFSLMDLTGWTKQLSAYGIAVDELLPTTHKLAELSAGLGVDMSRLILAYGQVNAAAVLRGQELRQFTEAGVPLVDKLADKFTELNGRLVTTGEVFELISKRQVSFEMVSEILSNMTSEGGQFYKMQESLMGTLYGQWEKVKDMWQTGLKEVGEATNSIFMRTIIRIQKLIKNLPSIVKTLGFAIAAKMAVDVWKVISRWPLAIKQFNRGLQIARARGVALAYTLRSITTALTGNIIIAALSAIFYLVSSIISKNKEWKKTLDEINTSFAKDTAKYVHGFDRLIEKLNHANKSSKDFSDTLSTLKANYGDFINDNMVDALLAEAQAAKEAGTQYSKLAQNIRDSIIAKKELERHESLKGTAANELIKELNIFKLLKDSRKYLSKTEAGYDKENKFNVDFELYKNTLKEKDFQTAFEQAFMSFAEAGETTVEEFELRMKHSLKNYGFGDWFINWVTSNIDRIFDGITDKDKWNTYTTEVGIITNTLDNLISNKFKSVSSEITGEKFLTLTGGGRGSNTYNPLGIDKEEYKLYLKAYTDLLGNKDVLPTKFFTALSSTQAYKDAIAYQGNEYEKGKRLNAAIVAYQNSLVGKKKENESDEQYQARKLEEQDAFNIIQKIVDGFEQYAGIVGQTASHIRTNAQAFKGFTEMNLTASEKDMIATWTRISEKDYDAKREALWNEIERLEEQIIKDTGVAGRTEVLAENKRTLKLLKVLTRKDLYYGDKPDTNKGSSPAESIPIELSDFLDKLKNAYERYKEATQKGGINAAVGYVKTDEQFTKMFGEFFGGAESEIFKNLNKLKVGDKTAMSLLQDKFITEGLENGILDFEAAIIAVANELEDYATDTNGKIIQDRKVFANASKQLKQYIHKTFSKDNLAIMLDEFELSLKNVTNTFEQTTQAVEAYKKTIQQGTSNKFGNIFGIPSEQAYTPKSTMQENLVKQLVGKYNTLSSSLQGETLDIEGMLSTPSDIYSLITELEKVIKMNNKNFGADVMGKPGQSVIAELKKLANTITEEITNISGKSITGNSFQNAVANAVINTKASVSSMKEVQTASLKYGIIDAATIEALLKSNKEQSQSFFDAFINSNQSTMMEQLFSGGIDKKKFEEDFDKAVEELKQKFEKEGVELPATLEFELELRKEDLKDKIDKFNAEGGKIGLGDEIRKYRNAPTENKELYDRLKQNVQTVTFEKISAESEYDELKPLVESGEAHDAQVARFEELTTLIPILNGQLAQYNAELDRIGENGSLETQRDRVEALANMQTKLNNFSQGMTQMQDAVIAVVDSIKSATDMFAKFYDIVNDGENPKWLEIMQEGMNDFIENFKTAVAPILAVVAAIVAVIVVVNTLTTACAALQIAAWPLLVIMTSLIAIAAIVAAVMTAIQAHDNRLQASIEDIEKEIEAFDRAAKQLNSTAERMVGLDRMKAQVDALGKSMSKATAAAEQARLEEEKKNTDNDKLQEYKDASFEAEEEFKNGLKDMLDELIGAVEDWSDAMSDAIRSAFQNGENAARSFRATVKEMIGDVVQKMLDIAILEPIIKGAIQDWTDQEDLTDKYTHEYEEVDAQGNKITKSEFDEEGYLEELLANIKDPKKAKKFYAQMLGAGDALIDAIENLPPELKDAYAFNSETSALSGGISGITEDTARQLEAIGNSQLIQLIQIKQLLETYAGSGLDRTHMAYVQTHLTLINNNVANIVKAISELRTTTVNPLHVTVI